METRRTQLNRVLAAEASNVTLDTLSRVARVLGIRIGGVDLGHLPKWYVSPFTGRLRGSE
ncbi:hypothetical protein [Brevundimonas sp.]|jgi:hypothetical protein|uniref:hypothetical protein n=1 Tax=Brevundimonas sp. TaxID=1871086 RepID=UPI0034420F2D